ncbi:MAG: hypothetical protein LUH50_24195 [Bacteroides intestinalis]|nr:hypothetical protein [Bacteroides intestinalis]
MKRIKEVFCFVLILSICISCNKKNDNMYFNGEIRNFEVLGSTKKVTLETISLDGANFGWLAVFDSLMIFRNPKLVNRFFSIFNVDNGEELGTFCNKGGGPMNFLIVTKFLIFLKKVMI